MHFILEGGLNNMGNYIKNSSVNEFRVWGLSIFIWSIEGVG